MCFVNRDFKKSETVDFVSLVNQFLKLAGKVGAGACCSGVHTVPRQVFPFNQFAQAVAAGDICNQRYKSIERRIRYGPIWSTSAVRGFYRYCAAVCLPVTVRPGHIILVDILANAGFRNTVVGRSFSSFTLPQCAQRVNGQNACAMVNRDFRNSSTLCSSIFRVISFVSRNKFG